MNQEKLEAAIKNSTLSDESKELFIMNSKTIHKTMYSEEEVLSILYKHTEDLLSGQKITLEEWFELFKKK